MVSTKNTTDIQPNRVPITEGQFSVTQLLIMISTLSVVVIFFIVLGTAWLIKRRKRQNKVDRLERNLLVIKGDSQKII